MNHPSFSLLKAIHNVVMFYMAAIVGFWSFLDYLHTGDKISFWAVIGASAICIGIIVTINEWLSD